MTTQKYRILLVDDQPLVLSALARYLEQEGYEVHTRTNGEEGISAAEELNPDVVITDVLMPVLDGWAVVTSLRSKPEFALTPIIVLTDLDTSEDRIRGFTIGADDFVSKNTIVEELEARIGRAVDRSFLLRNAISDHTKDTAGSPKPGEPQKNPAELADHWSLPSFDEKKPEPPPQKDEDQEPEGESSMRGNVDQIGLASILTLLSSGAKSGILTLTRVDGRVNGRIYLCEGVVLQANVDDEDDLDQMTAFCKIMSWKSAAFTFRRQEVSVEDELKTPTELLLMEASRILDEEG